MKDKIIKLLNDYSKNMYSLNTRLNITDIFKHLPEAKGGYALYYSAKKGLNQNILWLDGSSKEFNKSIYELINEEVINWRPENFLTFNFNNSPCYNMIICEKKHAKTQTHCWMPISIELNKKIKDN